VAPLNRPVALSYGWLLFAVILCLQFGLFLQSAYRERAWVYAANWDQNGYLGESFDIYEQMQSEGVGRGLLRALTTPVPQGKLMQVEAAILFLFTRPSRVTAWGLNFFYFSVLEFFIVYTLLSLDGRWTTAFMGLGLLLTTTTRFAGAGGMTDFRIDFIASCLYGILICLVARSAAFASRSWSVVAGAVAGLLIATRYLTAFWVAPVMGAMLFFFLVSLRLQSKLPEHRAITIGRTINLITAALVAFLISAPLVWVSRTALIQYYVVGQTNSMDSAVRRAEFGVNTVSDYLLYYLKNLNSVHLGSAYVPLAFAVLLLGLITAARSTPGGFTSTSSRAGLTLGLFLIVSFLMPFVVLTVWPSKSPVVGDVLVGPTIGITLILFMWLSSRIHLAFWRRFRFISVLPMVVALAGGVGIELNGATRRIPPPKEARDYRQLAAFYEEMGRRSVELGLRPKVAFDRVYTFLCAPVLTVLYYENHMVLLKPEVTVSHILAIPPAAAVAAFQKSDIIVLTDPRSPDVGFRYPFNQSMSENYLQLRAVAESEFVPVGSFNFFSQSVTMYVRSASQVDGASGGWITSRGVTLRQPASLLRLRPVVELSGETILSEHLGSILPISAKVFAQDGIVQELTTSIRPEHSYRITLNLDKEKLPTSGEVKIALHFGRYFVPKEIGYNDDQRQLVLMMPERVRLLPEQVQAGPPEAPGRERSGPVKRLQEIR
jgi:hypothetical protein